MKWERWPTREFMFTINCLISRSDTGSDGATKISVLSIDMRMAQLIVPRNLNLIGVEYICGAAGLKAQNFTKIVSAQ